MATAADTTWHVLTTGNSQNGAGYSASVGGVGSVDYSLLASPILTHTDATTSNASTALTIPGTGTQFDATMVGNMVSIVIAAVFTCRRQIVAFVSPTQVTLDSNPVTSSAGAATIRVGGAYKIDQNAIVQESNGVPVSGNVVHVGAGTYLLSSNSGHVGNNGSVTQPLVVKGFNTTRGDLDTGANLARPILKWSASTINIIQVRATGQVFRNLEVDNTGNGSAAVLFDNSTVHGLVENCKITGMDAIPTVDITGTANTFRNNYVIAGNGNADGVLVRGNGSHIVEYNHIRSTGSPSNFTGILSDVGTNCIRGNIVQQFTFGILAVSGTLVASVIENNIVHRCTNGIESNNAGQGIVTFSTVRWNIISRCTRGIYYAIGDISANTGAIAWAQAAIECNAFYGNTNNYVNLPAGAGDILLTADPFTNEATFDFSLNTTSGGGALVRSSTCTLNFADALNFAYQVPGIVGSAPVSSSASTSSMRSLWREYTNEQSLTVVPDATVDIYLQSGLEELNRRIRYHWTTGTITLVAGTQEYSSLTDLVAVEWIEWNGRPLKKADANQWRKGDAAENQWRTETTGEPLEYAFEGNRIILRPTPNAEAVATAATATVRYISTPPSITTSGPEQLNTQDQRVPVYWGVAEWSTAHPDFELAQQRFQGFNQLFDQASERIRQDYTDRRIGK